MNTSPLTGSRAPAPRSSRPSLASTFRQAEAIRAKRAQPADLARTRSFLDWVERGGFVADRERVDFSLWRAIGQVYAAVPRDPTGMDWVLMKPAQAGASIFAMLWTLWLALRTRVQAAYFLPVATMAMHFSQNRFIRLVRGNPAIHRLLGDPDTPHRWQIVDEGSATVRRILESIVYFSYVGGKISTESLPLDVLVFDEVQEMLLAEIEKAEERLAASPLRAILRVSTANFAGADIHYFWERSDQREFHTRCGCGPDGVVLTDCFDPKLGPLCIDEGNGSTPGVSTEPFFFCPRCKTILRDPQDGRFIAHKPDVRRVGFHWGQMLSPRQTAATILEKWRNRVDTGNFYRRVLGLPYADPETLPVTQAHLEAAQRPELAWGLPAGGAARGVVMGIDQMGAVNYVVLKAPVPDSGRMRVVWLEIIQSENPWRRCAELMKLYQVRACAVEALPNFNEAHRFARAPEHDGRVFVAEYQDLADELVVWSDRPRDKVTVRRTDEDARTRWTVKVDQYRMMSWSLGKLANGEVETPDARALTQRLRTDRGVQVVMVCRDLFWLHLQRVALVTEYREGKEDERRLRRAVKKVGIDPHFAYANMLCDVAWVRAHGTEQLLGALDSVRIVTTGEERPSGYKAQIVEQLPQMFSSRLGLVEPAMRPTEPKPTCGNCYYYDPTKQHSCTYRYLAVTPDMIPCSMHSYREEEPSYP